MSKERSVELKELQNHIRALACVEESDSPMISCYLDLRNGANSCLDEIDARHQILAKSVPADRAAVIGRASP
jgi:hypothetical protein